MNSLIRGVLLVLIALAGIGIVGYGALIEKNVLAVGAGFGLLIVAGFTVPPEVMGMILGRSLPQPKPALKDKDAHDE